jgi:hypothetical protein
MCTREKLAYDLIHQVQPTYAELPGIYQGEYSNRRYVMPVWAVKKWPKAKILNSHHSVYFQRAKADSNYPNFCLQNDVYPFETREDERSWRLPPACKPGNMRLYYAYFSQGEYIKTVHEVEELTLEYKFKQFSRCFSKGTQLGVHVGDEETRVVFQRYPSLDECRCDVKIAFGTSASSNLGNSEYEQVVICPACNLRMNVCIN